MPPYDRDSVVIEDNNRSFLPHLRGKRVRRLVLHVRRPSDVEHIAHCDGVEDLELWSWKETDFTALGALAVRRLRLVRGRQTSLRGLNLSRLRRLELTECRSLLNLSGLCVPALSLELCNSFDLDSLSTIEGLLSLDLGHNRIESFDFLTGCRSLRGLGVGTDPPRPKDFGPIINSSTLELVYCSWLKKAEIETISLGNPRLFVSSYQYDMLGGVPVSESYSRRLEAFNQKYGLEVLR